MSQASILSPWLDVSVCLIAIAVPYSLCHHRRHRFSAILRRLTFQLLCDFYFFLYIKISRFIIRLGQIIFWAFAFAFAFAAIKHAPLQ